MWVIAAAHNAAMHTVTSTQLASTHQTAAALYSEEAEEQKQEK